MVFGWETPSIIAVLCSGQRELCNPPGQTLDTYSTLGKKIEGQNSTFSPGTDYHFASNSVFPQVWSLRAHLFSPFWKKARYSTPLLLKSVKTDEISSHTHLLYLPPLSCRGLYNAVSSKKSVHFVESFVSFYIGFAFDALTTDNSTGIRQKLKQSVPRYSTNLRPIIWVGSPENRRWKNILLLRIRRQFNVEFASTPDQSSRWPLHYTACSISTKNLVFKSHPAGAEQLRQWDKHSSKDLYSTLCHRLR
jgi:hypothetical protein